MEKVLSFISHVTRIAVDRIASCCIGDIRLRTAIHDEAQEGWQSITRGVCHGFR